MQTPQLILLVELLSASTIDGLEVCVRLTKNTFATSISKVVRTYPSCRYSDTRYNYLPSERLCVLGSAVSSFLQL